MSDERLNEIEGHYATPMRQVPSPDDTVRVYKGDGVEHDIYELTQEVHSLKLSLKTLAQYAVHLGNCHWFQDGDVCTCGLAAFSELFDEGIVP